MRLVVVDAGPLIALSKAGHLDVLPALFDEVVVPERVLQEVAASGETRPGSEIRDKDWVGRRSATRDARVQLQRTDAIGAGEAEAILVAEAEEDRAVLLLDDKRARRAARDRGLRTLRTGALLVAAWRRGLLTRAAVQTAADLLQRENYLAEQAVKDVHALLEAYEPSQDDRG